MSTAVSGGSLPRAIRRTPPGAAAWLRLAAAPTFAAMAALTASSPPDMLCMAGHPSPLSGMAPMYLLMAAFHLPAWLRFGQRLPCASEQAKHHDL